jgi:O-Antigen ligase
VTTFLTFNAIFLLGVTWVLPRFYVLDLVTLLPISVFFAANSVTVFSTLTGDGRKYVDYFGNVYFFTSATFEKSNLLFTLASSVICFIVLLKSLPKVAVSPFVALLLLTLVVSAAVAMSKSEVFSYPNLLLLISVLVVLPFLNYESLAIGASVVWWYLISSSLVVFFVSPQLSQGICRDDKCGVLDFLFMGSVMNENNLALQLVIAMPFALLVARAKSGQVVVFASTWIVVLLTGSRSGLFAVILFSFLKKFTYLLSIFLKISVGATFLTATYMFGSEAFTGRGQIWDIARELFSHNWLLGLGLNGWTNEVFISGIGQASMYSPHNQLLDYMVNAGILGLLVSLSLFFRLSNLSSEITLVFLPVLGIMSVERPINFLSVDWATWPTLILLAVMVREDLVNVVETELSTNPLKRTY